MWLVKNRCGNSSSAFPLSNRHTVPWASRSHTVASRRVRTRYWKAFFDWPRSANTRQRKWERFIFFLLDAHSQYEACRILRRHANVWFNKISLVFRLSDHHWCLQSGNTRMNDIKSQPISSSFISSTWALRVDATLRLPAPDPLRDEAVLIQMPQIPGFQTRHNSIAPEVRFHTLSSLSRNAARSRRNSRCFV